MSLGLNKAIQLFKDLLTTGLVSFFLLNLCLIKRYGSVTAIESNQTILNLEIVLYLVLTGFFLWQLIIAVSNIWEREYNGH